MSGNVKKNGLADAAGQRDQDGRAADRDRALDDEPRRPERVGRQQVVDDDDEQPGEREQDQDRRLRLGPQPGDAATIAAVARRKTQLTMRTTRS